MPMFNDSSHAFDESLLDRQIKAFLNIKTQLQEIVRELTPHCSGAQKNLLEEYFLSACTNAITGMLKAETQETYQMHEERLSKLLEQFEQELQLEGDPQTALAYHHLERHLSTLPFEKRALLSQDIAHSEIPGTWRNHCAFLQMQDTEESYLSKRTALHDALIHDKKYIERQLIASTALIRHSMGILAETRLPHLKEANKRNELLMDIGWVGLGCTLIGTASVFGLAFPALAVPGLILGSVVLGYSALDFVKSSVAFYQETMNKNINVDALTDKTKSDIDKFKNAYPSVSLDTLFKEDTEDRKWANEKQWVQKMGLAASFSGAVLAAVCFAFVLPGIAVPMAAVIGVTVAALAIAASTAFLLGAKALVDRSKEHHEAHEVHTKMEEDTRQMKSTPMNIHFSNALDSTVQIITEVMERSPITPTNPMTSDPMPSPPPHDIGQQPPVTDEANDDIEREGEGKGEGEGEGEGVGPHP